MFNLIEEFSLNYNFKNLIKILAWKKIEEKNNYIFSAEETLKSLIMYYFKDVSNKSVCEVKILLPYI